MGGRLYDSHKGLKKGDEALCEMKDGSKASVIIGQYNTRWAEWYVTDSVTGRDFIALPSQLRRFPRRFPLTSELFNDISELCDRHKLDWFYEDYISRKTIDRDDVKDIYANWEAGFYDENGKLYRTELTENVRKLFAQNNLEVDL